MRETIEYGMKTLQDTICVGLEELDMGGKFREDLWERSEGGGGRTRIIEGRDVQKGGVNFSAVHGPLSTKISKALNIPANNFYATGVSIVLHPLNPWVPIIHMNVRYFETDSGHHWFGGGIDVTPHYVDLEEAVFIHRYLKTVCDKHDTEYYPRFKKWADKYFYIKHRKETRGIGGIFFDRLSENDQVKKEDLWDFVQDVGQSFLPIYTSLLENNKEKEYTDSDLDWQFHRRGRYVEFNLVWDKGTKFGLDTDGRTESILMSLPPQARWTYNHNSEKNEKAMITQKILAHQSIDWVR
jgi:coproporphyrinogen III oxidase